VPSDDTDVRLRERLVAGDEGALAEVYDRWSALVYTLAVQITEDHAAAEDVTQEVFVHLWERPHSYEPERGVLRSWLCLLARSRALDWTRRRQARARYHARAAAIAQPPLPDVEEALTLETEAKVMRAAVQALPAPQREVVELAYYQGRTYRQVAVDLAIPEGTAKSRLRVALAALAQRLEAEGIIER
jgi:RNA polymerase sigma-70 factor (ECF subfamily)